jgi:pantoate--beta-alanine ligase
MMQTLTTVAELRQCVAQWRAAGERIALVPTMGNLHDGHLQLVKQAQQRADRVVVSIFVNPMQFSDASGSGGDFERYPRTLAADQQKLAAVDVVFAPTVAEVYPVGLEQETRVEVPGLSDILCGAHRPGHFVGVATVVTKLFNMVQPDLALFGEKDFQQLLVIRRLVTDLCFPIEIIGVPTIREVDGLAMSSRNQYLSAEERKQAATLYQTLQWVREQLQADGDENIAAIQQQGCDRLTAGGFRPEYLEVRRARDLQPVTAADKQRVILAAAWLGPARLIDNLPFTCH